jgi:hypothetical protein
MTGIVLKSGDLAFYDAFGGLFPVKVLSVTGVSGAAGTAQRVRVRFTARGGLYKYGEELETYGMNVVPRGALIRNRRRIMFYRVEVDA